ncbi:MerR family transcriptional regulator [Streptomyces erythrochromogenes]|uniref:DNA polymerase III subunit beta family protein n=1 Tax=Streptomyces erythrochromogenes TaxID=285574 RepID=UPI002254ADA5|nr:MerR family transcriptional regulator [Streptomyces erythrochromogenes]MCX5589433.1 MerR family transcriptional regulator [Streptomyces erythrochromogenes]
MRSIGEMARDSGLSVSALRFYDGAGVLVPARVDPVTGYRWYGPEQLDESRVLARLRRAGMPLADIRLVLAGLSGADTDLVRGLLQAHLRRLEQGLNDARGEFSTVRALLERRENPMTSLRTATVRLTLRAPELAEALDSVRFAAGADPELPMLGGVLFDVDGGTLRLAATDRYRMAVARAGAAGYDGPRVQAVVPSRLTDAMRALLSEDASVLLTLDGGRVALRAGDHEAGGQCLDQEFPDYRRLVRLPAGRRALVDVEALRHAVETGPVRESEMHGPDGPLFDLSVLQVADGAVTVCEDGHGAPDRVAVNRAFLLQALAAGARDELIVEAGAPTAPLAVRRTDTEETFSILMPVRLDD